MTAASGAARIRRQSLGSTMDEPCRFRSSITSALTTPIPYHVYGGLQDNSSWVADSSYPGGITNAPLGKHVWRRWLLDVRRSIRLRLPLRRSPRAAKSDALIAYTHEIPRHPSIRRITTKRNCASTGILQFISAPTKRARSTLARSISIRSRDHGQSWDRISPDLTTNDPEKQKQEESGGVTVDNSSAEMHTSIYSISESPKNRRRLFGLAPTMATCRSLTDGGKNWTNVVENRQRVCGSEIVMGFDHCEASRYDEATAYATFDRHTYGDMKPYAYLRTTDYGKTWTATARARKAASAATLT